MMKIGFGLTIAFTFAIIVIIGIVVIEPFNLNPTVFAQNSKFTANLLGSKEVPPNHSKNAGMAVFTPTDNSIKYKVIINSINGVTAGHIHLGKIGQNGKVVATLFNFKSPKDKVLEQGMITSTNLIGELKGKQISSLLSAMKNGTTYVNVHTQKNPNGEIRGQIILMK